MSMRSVAALAVVVALAVSGCSGGSSSPPEDPGSSSAAAVGTGGGSPSPVDVPEEVVAPGCEEGDGRSVEELPDLTVPETVLPEVLDEDGEVVVEAAVLPAQQVDAGCVVRYDAPGGCLGEVRISAVTIPATTIPEAQVEDRTYPAVTAEAVTMPATRSPQVCRVEQDGRLEGVTRAGVVREGFSRDGVARPGDDLLPTVRLEPVRVPDVDVDPERLTSRPLPGGADVGVLTGRGRTAYVAPASVLFDTDQSTIRPAAEEALREIARRITATAPDRPIVVEGHTDDRGDAAYGQDLSERRAEAVARWLVREGGLDRGLITTRGFGETAPVVPNTSDANRQRNRRVVIVVASR